MKRVNPTNYYTEKQWNCIKNELDSHETPCQVIDLAIIENNYRQLEQNFPFAKIFYAVKANPNQEAMKHLAKLGTNFDCASIYELDQVLANGGTPDRISFGNTIKKRKDIKYAYEKGVRLFATDSKQDLKNISENAPGSGVFFRVLIDGSNTAEWPLSNKFGADEEVVLKLIPLAKKLNLIPRGISFHVGSQQNDVGVWGAALEKVSRIFKKMEDEHGIFLDLINLGGGLPAHYLKDTMSQEEYAKNIKGYFEKYFPNGMPSTIIMEPGRSLFGNAGVMSTSVVLISKKSVNSKDKWLYVDAGSYNGLSEAANDCIKFPLYTEAEGELSTRFIIAGNSCDSSDTLYKNFRNPLPEKIKVGDVIYWLSIGAYCTSCSAVNFNGYPPVESYAINSNEL